MSVQCMRCVECGEPLRSRPETVAGVCTGCTAFPDRSPGPRMSHGDRLDARPPCSTCGKLCGATEALDGRCMWCQRIDAANAAARQGVTK